MKNTKKLGTGGFSGAAESETKRAANANGLRLRIFAGMVASIMVRDSEWESSPVAGLRIAVRVDDSERVFINGKCAGNRHGGVAEFTRLTHEFCRSNDIGIHADDD